MGLNDVLNLITYNLTLTETKLAFLKERLVFYKVPFFLFICHVTILLIIRFITLFLCLIESIM